MIDRNIIKDVIIAYKESLPNHWKGEKYKWEAVKHFQNHWDINAEDFAEMFERATQKTKNLLASGYFYPRTMIINLAKQDAEAIRAMFIDLFNESKDLSERIDNFREEAENLRKKHDDGSMKNHYQNTNSISTYLWLRYPQKYYIYKYSVVREVSKELQSDFVPTKSSSVSNVVGAMKLYDEICEALQQDEDLKGMLESVITDSCYPDKELKTMTTDFGFFISERIS